jgi:hypothetical protein
MECPVMGTTKLLDCYGEGFVIFFSAIITGQPLILKHDSGEIQALETFFSQFE